MELDERLDRIWDRISDQDFLANRGVANEVLMSLLSETK